MSRRRVLAGLVALASTATPACGGDDGGGAATCVPGGAKLEVEARNLEFDRQCLAAPADTAFTIELDNRDSLPHNVAIKRDANAADDLFSGSTFSGPDTRTYEVPALPAGTWFFYCSVHPQQMTGRFVVG